MSSRLYRDFEQDPFFRDAGFPPMHMGFGRDPFESMFAPRTQNYALPGPSRGHHGDSQLAVRQPFNPMWPFGRGNPFARMDLMFQNMQQAMQQAQNNPNAHSFSSSTVMHFSSNGGEGGQPRVYHATSSTRRAPGGIKETRKSVRDSESGIHKMAVGHHIGDRSHTIEKQRNVRTKEMKEHQEFINLDETDAGHFDREWQDKTRAYTSRHHPSVAGPSHRSRHHHSERRGLPSVVVEEPHHISGRRRHRPPSLSEDGVEAVRENEKEHHHSKGVHFDDHHGQSSKHRKTQ